VSPHPSIRYAWRRLLCRLGRHYWYGYQFNWGGYDECIRCGDMMPHPRRPR